MKRIIEEYIPPEANQASIFSLPPQAIAVQYNGKLYIDYLVENQVEPPADAFYVGELLADGTVTDIIGTATEFPHMFAGWDRKPSTTEKPVIILSSRAAKTMLYRAGYLETIKNIIYSLNEEAIIAFEDSPYIHSDNVFVNTILTQIGLTQDEIYNLFLQAVDL